MAALYQERIDVLARKGLSDGEKIKLLSSIDRRFDQLKRETNTLSSKLALKAPDDGDAEMAVAKAVAADNEEPVQDEAASHDDQASVVAPKTPAGPLDLRTINVHPQMQDKAFKLLLTIAANPDVLSRNAVCELVLYGEPVVSSNFDAIIKAALTANSEPNLPGVDSFFRGLRTLNVKRSALSSRNFVQAFAATPRRLGPKNLGKFALEEEGAADNKHSVEEPELPSSPLIKIRKPQQTGKNYQSMKAPAPPCRRASVLYVY